MAKLDNGILGGFSGKVGTVIGYRWRDRWCVRARPTHVHNPRTAAQTAHRMLFREMVQLAGALKEGLRIGLKARADRDGMTEMNAFCRLNWHEGGRPDYGQLCVSEGPVAPVRFGAARLEGDVLRVAFEKNPTGRQACGSDGVRLLVFNAVRRQSVLTQAVARRRGSLAVALPTDWVGEELHLYGFVEDSAGRCSSSSYVEMEVAAERGTACSGSAETVVKVEKESGPQAVPAAPTEGVSASDGYSALPWEASSGRRVTTT